MATTIVVDHKFPQDKLLVIVSGASRGFGRAFVEELNKMRPDGGIDFILVARAGRMLSTLVEDLRKESQCKTQCIVGTLEDEQVVKTVEDQISTLVDWNDYDQAILINNAGSLGDPSQLVDSFSSQDLTTFNEYFAVNLSSFIALTGAFLKSCQKIKSRIVINISSIVAIEPLKGLSIYGAGKAARDAFIRSVSLEYPDVLCLNYAPGAMETDMAEILRSNSHLKDFYSDPTNLIPPKESVEKLLKLLKSGSFDNGAHIDIWDVK